MKEYEFKELPQCPFCGGRAIRVQHPGSNWDCSKKDVNIGAMYGLWYVGCPSNFFKYISPKCEISPSASWYAKLEDAEEHWRKRTIDLTIPTIRNEEDHV